MDIPTRQHPWFGDETLADADGCRTDDDETTAEQLPKTPEPEMPPPTQRTPRYLPDVTTPPWGEGIDD
jgi:hypothetical protein